MIRIAITILLLFGFANAFSKSDTDSPKDGAVTKLPDGDLKAWDAQNAELVDLEAFWLLYAERRGGLTWGRTDKYPEYDDVNEFDTLLIQLESGPCLMEFYHSRWRRANDVRRWDSAFNEYGGCPHVFD